MHAELRKIESNDFATWDEFASMERPEPWDEFGWFTLSIGPENDQGTELFQVLVSTHAAVSRAKGNGRFRGLIVDSFEPEQLLKSVHKFVSEISGHTWSQIVDQLRVQLHWEYEGMAGR